jgi:hypothetical protein
MSESDTSSMPQWSPSHADSGVEDGSNRPPTPCPPRTTPTSWESHPYPDGGGIPEQDVYRPPTPLTVLDAAEAAPHPPHEEVKLKTLALVDRKVQHLHELLDLDNVYHNTPVVKTVSVDGKLVVRPMVWRNGAWETQYLATDKKIAEDLGYDDDEGDGDEEPEEEMGDTDDEEEVRGEVEVVLSGTMEIGGVREVLNTSNITIEPGMIVPIVRTDEGWKTDVKPVVENQQGGSKEADVKPKTVVHDQYPLWGSLVGRRIPYE